jgi:hypothetical protein
VGDEATVEGKRDIYHAAGRWTTRQAAAAAIASARPASPNRLLMIFAMASACLSRSPTAGDVSRGRHLTE